MDLPYTCDRPGVYLPWTSSRRATLGVGADAAPKREPQGKTRLDSTPLCGTRLIYARWNHAEKRARLGSRHARRGNRTLVRPLPALFTVRNEGGVADPRWSRPIFSRCWVPEPLLCIRTYASTNSRS